ncbi:DegT/DnrJ/EryC1/StrS aminotransferase family protein [Nonomuraea longispora]|uniref:DegT/DnrJ/EryC1/StrS aminotransferase family protein n=1 Tax=Nonomuraea longispora TaxID=1848320 RepID=A0A4R4NKM2_9ACTN|nr:DegT/DnrJ/EryC1/StrS family aminotransferase [Nonomuraea longispora]TDC09931.1 DegT/DnrJ/EryC1/StrS aminotransferase family protein [Nonomuraea longispora]
MNLIAERTGRHCLSLPSNRLGLYLALRHWCLPGQRLLMSPISADEILFLVLAAGLRPVIAPLSARDGNIDVSRLDLDGVDAVLTTNLYGLPDRVSALTGKVLIEDVAHALESHVDGRPLGTFGQAGVFSLSKHAGAGSGGVLAVEDRSDLEALTRARDLLLAPGSLRADLMSVATSAARQVALRTNLVRPALALSRALGLHEPRDGYRIPLDPEGLRLALKQAPALPPFDPWVRADLHDYRRRRGHLVRWYQSRRVAQVPRTRARRLAGVRRLAELPTVAPAVLDHLDQPLFRVPLLVRDRDAAIAELERHGVATGYLYDPPYDDYAPAFAEASPHPGPARWWAANVLPVDPLHAARALPVLSRLRLPDRPVSPSAA